MGTHPIFESDFDCLTEKELCKMVEFWQMSASPPCRAVDLTARAVGVELKVTNLDLMKGEQMAPEFVAVNPAHCVPTIRDGDVVLWESRAICQYLCNKYAPESSLYPTCPAKRAKVDFLLNWDLGTLYKAIGEAVYPTIFKGAELDPEKHQALKEKLQFMSDHLLKDDYLCGSEVTIADISIACSLTMPMLIGFDYSEFEKIVAFRKRMEAQTGWAEVTDPFCKWVESMKKKE